jgi:hypothetical protein
MGKVDQGGFHACTAVFTMEEKNQLIAHCSQIFGVPSTARKSKPFIDHILTFSILDSKIWFRNFQVRVVISIN